MAVERLLEELEALRKELADKGQEFDLEVSAGLSSHRHLDSSMQVNRHSDEI